MLEVVFFIFLKDTAKQTINIQHHILLKRQRNNYLLGQK